MIKIIGDNTLFVNNYYINIGAVIYYENVPVPKFKVSKEIIGGVVLFESYSFKETMEWIEENT